jgi:hypothetical protein
MRRVWTEDRCWTRDPGEITHMMVYDLYWESFYDRRDILYDGTSYYGCTYDRLKHVYKCCLLSKEEALKEIVEQAIQFNGVRIHPPIYDESLIEVLKATAEALKERKGRRGKEYYPFLAVLLVSDLTGATTVKDVLERSGILLTKGTIEAIRRPEEEEVWGE